MCSRPAWAMQLQFSIGCIMGSSSQNKKSCCPTSLIDIGRSQRLGKWQILDSWSRGCGSPVHAAALPALLVSGALQPQNISQSDPCQGQLTVGVTGSDQEASQALLQPFEPLSKLTLALLVVLVLWPELHCLPFVWFSLTFSSFGSHLISFILAESCPLLRYFLWLKKD